MRNSLIFIILVSLLPACSLIRMESKYYKKEDGMPIQKKEMEFQDKQALAKGATINSKVVNDIYYNGTQPKSKEAQVALEFSYEVMGIFGVNTDFDLEDIENIKKAQIETRNAVEEKNRIIAKLEEDVKVKELEKRKIERDKEAELQAESGKYKAKMGSIFWGIIICVILLFVGAFAVQLYTGIPLFSGLLNGSLKTVGKLMHQTVAGVENFRQKHKAVLVDDEASEEEKAKAKEMLDTMGTMMNNVQDEDVRRYIEKLKKAPAVVRNIFNHNKNEKGANGRNV